VVDHISRSRRSWLMSRVRSKNTTPELRVRRVAHALGLRFRLHRRDLPGKPDLVFPKHRIAIFVHGCFWHRHENCAKATSPKSREEYWTEKFRQNERRDAEASNRLTALGWNVTIIWECETKDEARLAQQICRVFALRAKER
jgi:DNA mismatch endonuclease (patch repair protein)